VVAGLVGQVPEQVTEAAVGEPDPAVFGVDPEQHLRRGQGQQLGIAESGSSSAASAGQHHMIVDLHIQCAQEGVQVVRHSRSWPPSAHARVDRHTMSKESII